MPEKKRVCLVGALGKMGIAIRSLLENDLDLFINARVDPAFDPQDGYRGIDMISRGGEDVVINFSTPKATIEVASWCYERGHVPLVTGTTGLSENESNVLKEFSKKMPIIHDSNMSLGVNLIDALLPGLANTLASEGWDTEITELHHRMKKDSPSGTARRFALTISLASGRRIIQGREKGHVSERGDEIFVHSVRGGTIPGEHTIYFMGPDEVIEIHHRALSNKIFALGAVKAAKWIIGQKPGLYSMLDVLGLKK